MAKSPDKPGIFNWENSEDPRAQAPEGTFAIENGKLTPVENIQDSLVEGVVVPFPTAERTTSDTSAYDEAVAELEYRMAHPQDTQRDMLDRFFSTKLGKGLAAAAAVGILAAAGHADISSRQEAIHNNPANHVDHTK